MHACVGALPANLSPPAIGAAVDCQMSRFAEAVQATAEYWYVNSV